MSDTTKEISIPIYRNKVLSTYLLHRIVSKDGCSLITTIDGNFYPDLELAEGLASEYRFNQPLLLVPTTIIVTQADLYGEEIDVLQALAIIEKQAIKNGTLARRF